MSMVELPEPIRAIELDWHSEDDVIEVVPRNRKRFEIQKHKAIEILQLANQADDFERQFSLLLERLAQWIQEHAAQVARGILTLQDATFLFVVVRSTASYDENLEDNLLDLAFDIANDSDLNLIRLRTLALPNVSGEALRSFLHEHFVMSYGERSRSH